MVSPLRLGLIGFGGWGRRVAKTIAEIPGCTLTAVATRTQDARAELPAAVAVFKDWSDLINEAPLDGVIVATSPTVRFKIAQECIEHGIPAYLEKPITLTGADAEILAGNSARAGTLLSAGHLHLYAPAFQGISAGIRENGGPVRIVSRGGNTGPFRSDYRALLDYGPHDLSMILALAESSPNSVEARRIENGEDGVSEVIEAELRFPTCTATMTVGNLFKSKQRQIEVETPDATLVYDDLAGDKAVCRQHDGKTNPIVVSAELPLTASITRFSDMIRSNQNTDPDFRLAVNVMHTLDAVALAADTGSVTSINPGAELAH